METSKVRPGVRPGLAQSLGAALCLMATSLHAGPAETFYERAVIRAADQRCHLLSPEIGAALDAASLQARGAALRSGSNEQDLARIADRADAAAERAGCGSADIQKATDRVRAAFAGYSHMSAMRFPGSFSVWQADRDPVARVVDHRAVTGPRWRLSEPGVWTAGGPGPVMLGLAGDTASPAVVDGAHDAAIASTAFLTVRDPRKSDLPYLDPNRRDLAGRAPPASITRIFVAAARSPAPASLSPGGVVFGRRAGARGARPARGGDRGLRLSRSTQRARGLRSRRLRRRPRLPARRPLTSGRNDLPRDQRFACRRAPSVTSPTSVFGTSVSVLALRLVRTRFGDAGRRP
jgi:hypothetical protein